MCLDLPFDHLPHQLQHFPRLGVTFRLQFRVQQLSVDGHLKAASIRRYKRDLLDGVFVLFEQFIHQADGPSGVMSDRAVDNFDGEHGREFLSSGDSPFAHSASLRDASQKWLSSLH